MSSVVPEGLGFAEQERQSGIQERPDVTGVHRGRAGVHELLEQWSAAEVGSDLRRAILPPAPGPGDLEVENSLDFGPLGLVESHVADADEELTCPGFDVRAMALSATGPVGNPDNDDFGETTVVVPTPIFDGEVDGLHNPSTEPMGPSDTDRPAPDTDRPNPEHDVHDAPTWPKIPVMPPVDKGDVTQEILVELGEGDEVQGDTGIDVVLNEGDEVDEGFEIVLGDDDEVEEK